MALTQTSRNRLALAGLTFGMLFSASPAHAQEWLVRAKAHYAAAAYEDALAALASGGDTSDTTEVAAYRVFCLVALGRTDAARTAVEALVRRDPMYRPTESQVSPRVRTFFNKVRLPMLAAVVRETFAEGRAAFDRHDVKAASARFGQSVAVIDELTAIADEADPSLRDLRTLAIGFKDLADLAIAKADAVAAEAAARVQAEADEAARQAAADAAAAEEAARRPDPTRAYTDEDAGVVKPATISRPLPPWQPPTGTEPGREFSGVVEVIIDQEGKVESAVMRESVHARYDGMLLLTAKRWRFQPATLYGAAVKYRYRIGIRINAPVP